MSNATALVGCDDRKIDSTVQNIPMALVLLMSRFGNGLERRIFGFEFGDTQTQMFVFDGSHAGIKRRARYIRYLAVGANALP